MNEWNLQLFEAISYVIVPESESYPTRLFFDQLTHFLGQLLQDRWNVVTSYHTSTGTGVDDCKCRAICGSLIHLADQAGGIIGPLLQSGHAGERLGHPGHGFLLSAWFMLLILTPFICIMPHYPSLIYPLLIWTLWLGLESTEGQTLGQELNGFGTDVLGYHWKTLGRMLLEILYMKTCGI